MLRPTRLLLAISSFGLKEAHEDVSVVSHGSTRKQSVAVLQAIPRMPEGFFFPFNSNCCRLCGEVPFRGSLHTSSEAHQAVESIMWLLLARAKNHRSGAVGVSPEAAREFFSEEAQRWENVLSYSSSCFSSPLFGGGESEEKRNIVPAGDLSGVSLENLWCRTLDRKASQLRDRIHVLMQLGVLNVTTLRGVKGDLNGGIQRDAGFQRMECIGDHNWGHSICRRVVALFPEVNWRTPSNVCVINALRTVLESNHHLDDVFGALRLDEVLGGAESRKKSTKFKADVIEAIAGELRVALWSLEPYDTDGISTRPSMHAVPFTSPLVVSLRSCLNELLNFIIYCHLAKHGAPLVQTVVGLSRREQYLMDLSSSPGYALHKKRQRRSEKSSGSPRWILPPAPTLVREPRPKLCRRATARARLSLTALSELDDGATHTDGRLQKKRTPAAAVGSPGRRGTPVDVVRGLINACGAVKAHTSSRQI